MEFECKGCGVPEQVDDSLARRQVQLQLEAEQVAADLDLPRVLSEMGEPVRVGSAALGLMVHRDLDVTVVCPGLPVAGVARVGATLAVHRWVRQVLFRNDTGPWNVDPRYPDGLYLGLLYRSVAGRDGRSTCGSSANPTVNPTWLTCGHSRRG